jgi:hypothetical protein
VHETSTVLSETSAAEEKNRGMTNAKRQEKTISAALTLGLLATIRHIHPPIHRIPPLPTLYSQCTVPLTLSFLRHS